MVYTTRAAREDEILRKCLFTKLFYSLLNYGADSVISADARDFRLMDLLGVWVTIRTLLFGVDLPGWASLVVAISFLGGVQLISISVLGEYIARIFIEVKGHLTL